MSDHGDLGDEEPVPSLAMGTLIGGKYRVEKLIGRGGMGSVWSAVHTSLGQRVAVKLIAKRFAASREARHRFDLEAKAVAQLRSRYVVQVYDHGETEDGTPYIVMELLEGESLDARLSRGPLTLAATSSILDQISRALSRAHALGMVHRDLKPENVFLTTSPDDDGEVAKVLDFGIVKMRGHEGIGSTRTGAVLGTPLYMSPEQARGLKTVDHRTDLYSLGMVTYTMLTGQPAFTGESLGDLLVAICTEPLPQLTKLAHWLSPPIDAWFQRACARDPSERFTSVEEMTTEFAVSAGLRTSGPVALTSAPAPANPVHPQSIGVSGVGAVTGPTPGEHTAAPFSVTDHDIPKRSLAMPVAIVAGVVALAGAIVVTRLGHAPSAEPPASANVGSAAAISSSATPSAAPLPVEPVPAPVASAPHVKHPEPEKHETPKPPVHTDEAHPHVAIAPVTSAVAAASAKPGATRPSPTVTPAPVKPQVKPAVDLGF
ncbi:MAG TPA: protein kinase [Polyangiaceae bacterium]|jgi:serine/threonine-protein kinase|nr:protein kinase [Polyangiaceae bacterium]